MAKSHPSVFNIVMTLLLLGGRPPKPWEREGNNNTSGPKPFRPPSNTSTADSVEASGTANPGELVSSRTHNTATNMNPHLSRPVPSRPWLQQNYGGNGPNLSINSRNGSLYGGGMYNRGVYGGGSLYGSSGMYGGGYGMGMSPYGGQDPNDPYNQPPSPPGFWISFLRVLQSAVNFFGRVAMLIDQNTQAFHMLLSALLQLCDRGGMLYGELARFVLRLLGVKAKPRKMQQQQQQPLGPNGNQNCVEGTKAAGPSGGDGWDNVWSN
ncbi:unnamed protein product [Eruca vesicaria subsp. sativa]|uniref:Peroxin-13 n=1 Tax=Eruca vesicaria subsp. sativa TaxID=29727 RepID=A0ABC8KBU3_ERUVS|nr:unnamed protein product [Eruca vesicaria subsp. sativa]